jgi:hypothetical protein
MDSQASSFSEVTIHIFIFGLFVPYAFYIQHYYNIEIDTNEGTTLSDDQAWKPV